jgi:selenocysteine lyase/cysteine desulfurase
VNGVRAATHIYNMPGEVDRLLEAVTHVAANASRYMTTTAARG